MPTDWEIARPSGTCHACGRAFEVGEEYYSVLIDRGDAFERRDFCLTCRDEAMPGGFSCWKTRVPEPDEERKLLVDEDVIVNFFHRLAEEADPLKVSFRFIVALILMRKRVLKFETTEEGGETEFWVLRMPRDASRHRVVNPRLDDDEIDRLSAEVGALLNVET